MGKFDRFCQSCGMPMDQDPGKGGTNQMEQKQPAIAVIVMRMEVLRITSQNQVKW